MVEAIKPFQVIQYTTSDGEKCTATKKDGIVTVQGDKKGVRQVPEKEFMDEFIKDQSKVYLERNPKKDEVSFGKANREAETPTYKKTKTGRIIGGLLGSVGTALASLAIIKRAGLSMADMVKIGQVSTGTSKALVKTSFGIMWGLTALGFLGAGAIVDKCINVHRKHKAQKAAQEPAQEV